MERHLGVDVTCVLPSGATCLHLAAQQCHLPVVEVLTDLGIDGEGPCPANALLDVHNGNGQTPLTISAERGRTDIMELLLAAKANPEMKEATETACPPLICAAKLGVEAAVKCLLRCGVDVNAVSSDNTSALYHACFRGDDSLSKCLIDARADLEVAESTTGNTPVFVAAVDCNIELVTRLLRDNADVDLKNNHGLSARLLLQKVYELTIDTLYVHSLSGRSDADFGVGNAEYEKYIRDKFAARCGRYHKVLDLEDLTVMVEQAVYDIPRLLKLRQRKVDEQSRHLGVQDKGDAEAEREEDEALLLDERKYVLRMLQMHYPRLEAMYYASAKAASVASADATEEVEIAHGLDLEQFLVRLSALRAFACALLCV